MNNKKILILILLVGIATLKTFSQPPSDTSRAKLHAIIDSVQTAEVYVYDAKDNLNQTMDCAKIIPNPQGGFLAVYHHYVNGEPRVFLASSSNFINWEIIDTLAFNASQPDIQEAVEGGYIMAWEQEPDNHIKVVYYLNLDSLFNGSPSLSYDIPRTLSDCAEGTPNIYYASISEVDLGFHYYMNCDVDREAHGVLTDFNTWNCEVEDTLNNSILYWGVEGNIGDRDDFEFDNYNFLLIEGQYTKNDFSSWRSFIFDCQTGNAEQLDIVTHNGSTAFANPTATIMEINGRKALVNTFFIFSEGAAPGEAGELMYYHFIEEDSNFVANKNYPELSNIIVYPNPASDFLNVKLKKHEKINYFIEDLTGRTLLSGIIIGNNTRIDIKELHRGIYLLKLKGKETIRFSVLK